MGFGTNGRTDWSLGLMAIMSRSWANQAAVWRKKSLLPGKFTNALLANVEFPMTTMAGWGFPSAGGVLGASAAAMGSGPLMSAFSSRAMMRPVAFITDRLLGDVRASGTKSQSF